jgi:hypothetical protein
VSAEAMGECLLGHWPPAIIDALRYGFFMGDRGSPLRPAVEVGFGEGGDDEGFGFSSSTRAPMWIALRSIST